MKSMTLAGAPLPPGIAPPGIHALGAYPAVGAVHQNVPLQNFVVGYADPMFVADDIFPVLPVVKESDSYYEFRKSSWYRREETLVPDRAQAREVTPEFTLGTYTAQRYGLQASISQRERSNADGQLRLEQTRMVHIKNLLMMDTEIRLAGLLSLANTSGVTLSSADIFDNASFTASGVPIENRIDTGKEAVRVATGGRDPNVIVIPSAVAKVIKRDSKIRDLIRYTHQDLLVDGDLPPMLWGMKVVIPKSITTTSPEGTAEGSVTYTDIWGKDIRLMYVAPAGTEDFMTPTLGYQMRLVDDNYSLAQWSVGAGRNQIDYFEVSVTQDMKLTLPTACYVIKQAIT